MTKRIRTIGMVALVVGTATTSFALTAVSATVEDDILKWGHPDTGNILVRDSYIVSHDGRSRSALWVLEHLTKDNLEGPGDRDDSTFLADTEVDVEHRSGLDDYSGSGFDRGHLSPAGDNKRSQDAMDQSFFLSNIAPQSAGFNRGYWATFEGKVRELARRENVSGVWVFTGSLFLPDDAPAQGTKQDDLTVTYTLLGPNHIPIATHFFKAVLAVENGTAKVWAFILPHESIPASTPLDDFAVSTDYLEHWSGLDFWSEMQDTLETFKESVAWEAW